MPRKSKYEASTTKTTTAQKEAVKAYRARNGGAGKFQKTIGATFPKQEGDRIAAAMKDAGITPAQIMRAAWYRLRHNPAEAEAIRQDAENARTEYAAQTTTAPAPQPAEHPADPAPADSPEE